jgi:dTDP-4-dehydrorhamnose reductase
MKLLITGSNGLLGQKIVKQCLKNGIAFLATSKGENRNPECPLKNYHSMDICNSGEINETINMYLPTHVIHTAALTNVDYCELNPDECQSVNVGSVEKLLLACKTNQIHFQFLSTDFVFDGLKGNYSEEDAVGPLSVYAKSKVDGENLLKDSDFLNWSIVRTIIVYGNAHNLSRSNIVLWAKSALAKGDELSIVDDQFRAPTWADDLAWACIEICKRNKIGTFHISGPETMSIYQLVERIAKHFGFSAESLKRSSSLDLSQPAKRPPHTGFNLSKAKSELGYSPHTFEQTLDLI